MPGVQKFLGLAFIADNCHGNPATTVLLDSEFLPDKDLANLAIENSTPISSFVVPREKKNQFDIRYFFPNGKEIPYCGHGTIVTTAVLSSLRLINLEGDVEYFLNPTHTKTKNITGRMIDQKSYVEFPYATLFNIEDGYDLKLNAISAVFPNVKSKKIKLIECQEDNDILVVCDIDTLCFLDPNLEDGKFANLMRFLNKNSICFTAPSKDAEYNYQTRLFDPGLSKENKYEDFACGSANMYVASYWHMETGQNHFKTLYPFRHYVDGCLFGGRQVVNVDKANNKIAVGGDVVIKELNLN